MICTVHRMSASDSCLSMLYSLCSCFWKYLKALNWTRSLLEPQSVKNKDVFIMNLQKELKCCGDPCIVLLFSLLDFPLFPQPSVHLSSDITVSPRSHISQV